MCMSVKMRGNVAYEGFLPLCDRCFLISAPGAFVTSPFFYLSLHRCGFLFAFNKV